MANDDEFLHVWEVSADVYYSEDEDVRADLKVLAYGFNEAITKAKEHLETDDGWAQIDIGEGEEEVFAARKSVKLLSVERGDGIDVE